MKANICQVCGGKLKNFGTYFRCENCDTEYRIDESLSQDDMDAYFRRLNDFEDAERNLDVMPPRFDEAESEFERIIRKYPDWSAGYWGLVRSKFGIKFENDLDGKAVPSCYKSTYEDFCDTDEYNMAVELAETEELRQSYIKWAEYIARVTKEWRQTAQKYNYDVFISFKASEDSDGRETRDAREMHKLYDLLRDKGYRVFFSPVTLVAEGVAGKGSEPYIFNALDKSRALIVYGSKKEYFTSTWVQNEWQRYLRFIKEGKKEKGSLLVLYQGFNPKELPQGLRRIQGIEYGISAWPAISAVLEQILNKGKNEKAAAEEAARKAEEKRRAEDEKRKKDEESANKLRDMLAQFAQMQAELARLKSAANAVPPVVQPPSSPVKPAASHNSVPTKTSDVPVSTPKPVPAPHHSSAAKATDPYHGQNPADFQIKDGVLVKYVGNQSKVIIPDNVTSIGEEAFKDYNILADIVIPSSVSSIKRNAFRHCENLSSIVIPNSVTSIGGGVFSECSSLTNIVIPNSVTNIDFNPFSRCEQLESIIVQEGNSRYYSKGNCIIDKIKCELIAGCKNSVIPCDCSITSIGKNAFEGCTRLSHISIPDSVSNIGFSAFHDCSGLKNVIISNNVKSIGVSAFEKCSRITSLTIPGNLSTINGSVFKGCRGLLSIVIPKGTTIISEFAFIGCDSLINIKVERGNTRYYSKGNCIIEKDSNKLVLGCRNSVIPDDGSITKIGDYAFDGCSKLTGIIIPETVTSIGAYAFHGCNGLTNLKIPDSVTEIGRFAFQDCDGLKSVIVSKDIPRVEWAFDLDVDIIRKDIYKEQDKDDFKIENGTIKKYIGKKNKVIVPNNVTSIGKQAFYHCKDINYIIMPKSVTYIDDFSFAYCISLKSIDIPPYVKSVGNFAFYNCISLKSVVFSGNIKMIDTYAFAGCKNLEKIVIPKDTEISQDAFDNGIEIIRK